MYPFISLLGYYLTGMRTSGVPYTYRDGITLLELVKKVIDNLDDTNADLADLVTAIDKSIKDLQDRMQTTQDEAYKAYALADQAQDGDGLMWDVALGGRTSHEVALGHAYDQARLQALQADQADRLELTCDQWADKNYTARDWDTHALRANNYGENVSAQDLAK